MDHNGWKYIGDVSIRHGGFYWRETSTEGEIDVVQVEAMANGGWPDNMFRISVGLVDLNRACLDDARIVSGVDADNVDKGQDVAAVLDYEGVANQFEDWILRIGPQDKLWNGPGEHPTPTWTLRDGTSLRKWIQREYLHPDREEKAQPASGLSAN